MRARKPLLASALTILAISAGPREVFAQASPQMAPLNPAFVRFMQRAQTPGAGVHAKGFVPSPFELRHLAHQRPDLGFPLLRAAPSFDLRTADTTGHLTPVRYQGQCGACWAFATFGSLESGLMPGEPLDFSENNLKNNSGFTLDPCAGGNTVMSAAYLTRWSGPVLESEDPYQETVGTSPTLPPAKHVEEILLLGSRSGAGSPADEVIKTALTTYKTGVTAAMKMDETYMESTNHAYLYRGSSADTDHMVLIVGWDDNFDKNKFSPPANANGAFIARNSWGDGWGESGYFYVSYEDPLFGTSDSLTVFVKPAEATNYHRIHLHDSLGVTGYLGYGAPSGWAAVAFSNDAVEMEQVKAIGLYALAANMSYEIYIYGGVDDLNPRSGKLLTAQPITGTLAYAGYHTIKLGAQGVAVPGNKRWSVVVKLTADQDCLLPLEKPVVGYADATADYGESYASQDGETWGDMHLLSADTSVAMKVFGEPSCDDGNDCTTDSGDPLLSTCTHTPLSATTCDDGNGCTESDTCDNGVCKGTDKVCPVRNDACYGANTCNTATGNCEQAPLADGTACDDANPCTEGDHCTTNADGLHACAGLDLLCKAEECWVGHCEVQAGGCVKEKAPDGTACDNGTCRAGSCQRVDALRSYACGSTGAPASLFVLGLVMLALWRRRAAHR